MSHPAPPQPPSPAHGSLVASHAHRAHVEMERAAADPSAADAAAASPLLPIEPGVAHSIRNLAQGTVVDIDAKKRAKLDNERYLRAHPELNELIQDFVVHVLETRPSDIEQAAIEFFVREGGRRSGQADQAAPASAPAPTPATDEA